MFSKFLYVLCIFAVVATPTLSVLAQTESLPIVIPEDTRQPDDVSPTIPYQALMRGIHDTRIGKTPDKNEQNSINQFEQFLETEKERLDVLDVPRARKSAYLKRVKNMYEDIYPTEPGFWERIWDGFKDFTGIDTDALIYENEQPTEIKIPKNPAAFTFDNQPITILPLRNPTVLPQKGEDLSKLLRSFKNTLRVGTVSAEDIDPYLPILADTKPDGTEITIDTEIQQIARNMEYNPVTISNFVRNRIVYEPYFGAKKGALGCLHEMVCNDTDASSLTIALMRASGIPAHYKKSIAIFRMDQLKQMLGVDSNNTVYAALFQNKIPAFTLSGDEITGSLDEVDLSGVTHLALEWTFSEIFYDYDERGGNIVNALDLTSATSTEDLQTTLAQFPTKQWVPVDTLVRPYTHVQKEIAPDSAGIDAQTFFNSYLQYQGALSPIEKFTADVSTANGKDITNPNYQSVNTPLNRSFAILAPRLPYSLGSGVTGDGEQINPETWSVLPDTRKHKVKISLIDEASGTELFSFASAGSEINNKGYDLVYLGYTEQDQAIIDSYGGVHATPAELAQIKPILRNENVSIPGNTPIAIGQKLLLRFTYTLQDKISYTDEKFSTAGNYEGIFISLSRVSDNALLDDTGNPDRNSLILLEGNYALAREYLRTLQTARETVEKTFDYSQVINFERAVVTQNRILNSVNGTPTTFDFKGLTLDATSFMNDFSNRGNYKQHRKDTRLLFGLFASWYEGQLFNNIAGLTGISTVKGLQYASAHPETYTVHTITQANENAIDTLALSENTKANMHADVQAGNTIYTPDKPVSEDAWNGIFYISLKPTWDGTYAIGEQTGQNGGFSTDEVLIASAYDDQNNFWFDYYYKSYIDSYFAYQDGRSVDSIACTIGKNNYNQIISQPDWRQKFGFPCLKATVSFGDYQHTYILASNGSKFYSPNKYNYWITKYQVDSKINAYIQNKKNLSSSDLNWLPDGEKYKSGFSTILGTYKQSICESDGVLNCGDYATVYFIPYQSGNDTGKVYRARTVILNKLDEDNKTPIKKLGFPQSDEKWATDSANIAGGRFQDFINGQVYRYKSWGMTWTYYTYGKIWQEHNTQGGTGGSLGFPDDDPDERNGYIYQIFENENEIGWNLSTGLVKVEKYKKYRCELYKDTNDPIRLGLITLHGILDTGVQTVKDFGSLFMPVLKGMLHAATSPADIAESTQNLAEEASKIKINDLKNFLLLTGKAIHTELASQYDTSVGPNGCSARTNYLGGKITGEILLIYIPTSKLSALNKIKAVKYAQESRYGVKIVGTIGKWLEYRQGILDNIVGWVVPGKFERKRIEHVILGEFNEATGKFQGKGLHSVKTLENGMTNNALEVANVDDTSKIYKKIPDLPIDKNGVRKATVKKTTGYAEKTFFPETWSDKDIVDGIIEASAHPTGNNKFSYIVTKNNKSVPISGYFKPGTNIIDTGFPDFTN